MIVWLALSATAAEPCYGWTQPNVVEGQYASVEYEDLVTEEGARAIVEATDIAWERYEAAGFVAPIGAPSLSIEPDPLGRGGFARTELCGEEHHSKLFVYEGGLGSDGGRNTAVHELFHAVQYGYDPSFDFQTHFTTWPWWSEGTATWAEQTATGNVRQSFNNFSDYLEAGHLALHQDFTALLDAERGAFIYGTALLAYTLEDNAGTDAIAATFEVGARDPGELAWFPEVLAEIGVDFDELWVDHLRRLPTVDYPFGRDFDRQAPQVSAIRELAGSATADPDNPPQGLGWALHRIRPDLRDGSPITVTFTGEDGPRWHVVLVSAPRNRAGAPATILHAEQVDGTSPLTIEVDYVDPTWIVVSPEIDSSDGFDYTVELDVVEAPEPTTGCGCASGTGGALWLLPWAGLLALRRRRRG